MSVGCFTLTREGKRFLIAAALIGFAAFNTGNNLIYLIFSMMLSIFFLSVVIPVINLRGLGVVIDFKYPVYASVPCKVDISLKNDKAIPSYSVSIVFPSDMSRPLYFPVVKKGVNEKVFDNVVFKKRGRYFLKDFKLKTGFPFIFLYAYRSLGFDKELIVYPEPFDVSAFLPDVMSSSADTETLRRGEDEDFLYLREYVYGEESRNIDWKATARTRKPMIREFSGRENRKATVIIDNGGGSNDADFEKAVSIAASLCSVLVERDFYVRLITCEKVVPFGKGRAHLFKTLDTLAEIRRHDTAECPVEEAISGVGILVISSDTPAFSRIIPLCSRVIHAGNI